MLIKRDPIKQKKTLPLTKKGDVEFFITTFVISLLTLVGFFISHYNKGKYDTKVKVANSTEIPTETTNKTFILIP